MWATVARRYLRSTRSDAMISSLSRMAIIGLTLGVAALVIAMAVLSGFQASLLADMLARTPTLQVEPQADADPAKVAAWLGGRPGVANAQVLRYGHGWLVDGSGHLPVQLVAWAEHRPRWFPEASTPQRAGRTTPAPDPQEGVWIGTRRARAWALPVGSRLRLVTPKPTLTPLGRAIPTHRQLTVVGTWQEGRAEGEVERVGLPLSLGASLLSGGELRVDVEVAPGTDPFELAKELRESGGNDLVARVMTWRDLESGLSFILRMEKTLVFTAVFLIVVVASLGLVAALALILASKRGEVGALSAMGARPASIRATFLGLGLMVAAIGTVGGALLGTSISYLLDRFEVISLPPGVFIVERLPLLVRPVDVLIVMVVTLVLSGLASVWVGRRASQVAPIEAIRS